MPTRARRYCSQPSCTEYATQGSYCDKHAAERARASPREYKRYERWYGMPIWKCLRSRQLAKEPLCAECKKQGRLTQATEVDHIRPHRGDWSLFVSESNLQSLCASCHSKKTHAERGGRGM